jgi:hypothetical protein
MLFLKATVVQQIDLFQPVRSRCVPGWGFLFVIKILPGKLQGKRPRGIYRRISEASIEGPVDVCLLNDDFQSHLLYCHMLSD